MKRKELEFKYYQKYLQDNIFSKYGEQLSWTRLKSEENLEYFNIKST